MNKSYKPSVKALVKVSTMEGRYCLQEIHGLEEGAVIEGKYNEDNHGVEFTWHGQDAILFVGDNCEIIAELATEYVVAEENNTGSAEESEYIFTDLKSAKDHMRYNDGYLFFTAYWIVNGMMLEPSFAKTERTAISKANKEYNSHCW